MSRKRIDVDMTPEAFAALPAARVVNSCGPCVTFYRALKENRTTWTLVYRNGDGYTAERVQKYAVHFERCTLCAGPGGSYPDGYQG